VTALAQKGGGGSRERGEIAQGSRGRSPQTSKRDCKQKKAREAAHKAPARNEAASSQQASEQLQSKAKSTKLKVKNQVQKRIRFSTGKSCSLLLFNLPELFSVVFDFGAI
jgi:uncharacterized FlaG/YvyC family protein